QKHLLDVDRRKDSAAKVDHLGKHIFLKEYQQAIDTSFMLSKITPLGTINYVNQQLCRFSGYNDSELLGKNISLLQLNSESRKSLQDIIASMGKHTIWRGLFKGVKKDGAPYHVKTTLSAVHDEHGHIIEYICIQQDISDVIDAAQTHYHMAEDPITKLPNRALLLRDLKFHEQAILAVLNIDDFKHVNELYGFAVGDSLLYALGQKLCQLCDSRQHTIYRLSGDEFGILQWNHSSEEAFIDHIEALLQVVNKERFFCQNHRVSINVTAGISARKNQLINAEMAMSHAKNSKSDIVFFDKNLAIRHKIIESIYWANKVREAIEYKHLVLFTQAIHNNHSGQIDHHECLVRIREDNGDIIPPSKFLSIAKTTRLYPQITQAVIQLASDHFARQKGHFSINMSILDAANDETISALEQQLSKYPGLGQRLIIEIVEEEGIENHEQIADFISRLKDWGCKIAIDDFGTGYSNFDYLMKLNVDYIKIDGSIIHNIHEDNNAELVSDLIVKFAKQLNIKTIAEYVHSKEVFEKVKEMGIDYSQGYFIGRPEPMTKVAVKKSVTL
ncbi:MAG: EAL domain-containing protein, partial [Cellvibrionaceae bacterium]|nr:EAL domain-containing protein [Cellvibrionaceae bacterium]